MLSELELHQRCQTIKLLLLDVDGVLTDGKLYYTAEGTEIKCFNTLDGHGIKMLRQSGVEVGIITGRESPMVTQRAKNLGIHLVIQGREDKFVAMQELLGQHHCDLNQIAFMGDDLPDLLVMTKVGLALTVPNAHPEVNQRAHWVTQNPGGFGAVREACDLLMQSQGTYQRSIEPYVL